MENGLPKLKVGDFVDLLNQTFEYAYPSVIIEGEVESFKVNQGKYVFFNLKDDEASVGCFMMLFSLRSVIEDGMKVVIKARPKITKWGKFSLTVDSIRPSGEGDIKKSFDKLKTKLETEGLFAAERKRSLPQIPRRVGVISSVQSAGYADFMKIADERFGGVKFDVYHTQVQGVDAPDQMIKALKYFNEQQELPEVLVLIRGGGSADDLAAFNDELLVREIAASRIPVLVGVGHEVDTSLVDLAADVRAATPSNAAQILLPDKAEMQRSVARRVEGLKPKLIRLLDERNLYVGAIVEEIAHTITRHIEAYEQRTKQATTLLTHYNPQNVLERGYAILRGTIEVGVQVELETARYNIKAEVIKYDKK
jgi:exodeoxyribonuclease VII large subunit